MAILAILTNARAADQRSMIGYGDLLLETARHAAHDVVEFRASSFFARLLPARVTGWPRKLANNLDRFIATPARLIGRTADIVHVVDPGNVVYLPLIRHRRAIVTVHDMIPYLARDGMLQGWQPTRTGRWLMTRITAALAMVDHIVCVSRATRRDVLNYVDIPADRVSVIHNAVFQPMKPSTPEACAALRGRLGLPVDAPLILHVGRNWYKNRETVLEMAAKVRVERPDVHLVMVGGLTPDLAERAGRLDFGEACHVVERIAQDDMATLYTTAAVLLFPSHYEGFGLPVLEAQMCGTPVVCSDRGALPEVAGKGCAIVELGDLSRVERAVLDALHGAEPDPIAAGEAKRDAERWRQEYLAIYAGGSEAGVASDGVLVEQGPIPTPGPKN